MKKSICCLAFVLVRLIAFGQTPTTAELEKKLAVAPPHEQLEILLRLGDQYTYRHAPEKYADYALRALEIARQLHEPRQEALAQKNLGYGYYRLNEFQKALESYFQARSAYEKIGEVKAAAGCNSEIGNIFNYCLSDYPTTLVYYNKALDMFNRSGDRFNHVKSLNNIADVYKKLGKYETAARYLIQALTLCEKYAADSRVNLVMAPISVNLSDIYMILGDNEKAFAYLAQARENYERTNRPWGVASVISRNGDWYKQQKRYAESISFYLKSLKIQQEVGNDMESAAELNKLGDVYSLQGDFVTALDYFKQSLDLHTKINDQLGMAQTLARQGSAYKRMGKFREALVYFHQSLALCHKIGCIKETKDIYLELSDLHTQTGNPQQALKYRQLYEETKENLQGSKVTAAILDIINRYEKGKMSDQIIGLQRGKARILFMALVAGCALLSTAIFFFWRSRRIKRRSGHLLQSQEHQLQEHRSHLEQLKAKIRELEEQSARKKYAHSCLSVEQAHEYLQKLQQVMESEKPYLESELTLKSLADKILINTSYLSRVINEYVGKKFFDFINDFRVEEAKHHLQEKPEQEMSVLDVGFKVGFNSKSNFYKSFKKATGLTPLEFRKKLTSSRL